VPPRSPWADVCLPHHGFFMIAYVPQLCNCFPVWPPPVRRRPAAASRCPWDRRRQVARLRRALRLASPTCPQPSLHVDPRTPFRPPVRTASSPDVPLLPHAVLRSLQVVDLPSGQHRPCPPLAHDALRRTCPPQRWWVSAPQTTHSHRLGASVPSACGGVECGETLQHHTTLRMMFWDPALSAAERCPLVPTGENPLYLRERTPCTYGREPLVPTGENPLYLWERKNN
jgi:hypothetical protein